MIKLTDLITVVVQPLTRDAFISVFWAKDQADLYAHIAEDWGILGEEVQEMINDLSSTINKFEKIQFWYMEDSSYSPE